MTRYAPGGPLEHDPEKWAPVFGKDHAPRKRTDHGANSSKSLLRWRRSAGSTGADAQELKIGLSAEPSAMDPHFHNLTPNNSLTKHIFDRLTDQDENQLVQPSLALSWRTTDDTTWEFKLRPGREILQRRRLHRQRRDLFVLPRAAGGELAVVVRHLCAPDLRHVGARSAHPGDQDRGAASAAADRALHHRDPLRQGTMAPAPSRSTGRSARASAPTRRPRRSTPARRRSAPVPTSWCATPRATASSSSATRATGAKSPPGSA